MSDLPPPPPPPPPSPGAAFVAPYAQHRIRWGISDAAIAFLVGLVGGVLGGVFFANSSGSLSSGLLIGSLVGQETAIVVWLVFVSRKKGLGTLGADFGFTWRPTVARGFGEIKWLFVGVGLSFVASGATALLTEIYGTPEKQDVAKVLERSHGAQAVAIALLVPLIVPAVEELLFRGVLLRGLLRRTTPEYAVLLSAVVFGLVHPLTSPEIGSLMALPGIMLLALVAGYQAVKTGDLGRPVMLHVGFNLLSVIVLFAG